MRAAALFAAFVLPLVTLGAATAAEKASVRSITFKVVSVESGPNAVWLNSQADFRRSDNLSAKIEPAVAAQLARLYDQPLHSVLKGKTIKVEQRFGGTHSTAEVRFPDQIQVVN
ncbi:hypothetical protein [Caulobacter sp. NIBR2454]|uniref:hypothetical protein n=1 Tax=Caulobacter sp. NIBR2454 TaxID=3015996 RepID=UPI0022B6FFA8|nr:hypothetical protein [Caulobacter sp. NIBR2454]